MSVSQRVQNFVGRRVSHRLAMWIFRKRVAYYIARGTVKSARMSEQDA